VFFPFCVAVVVVVFVVFVVFVYVVVAAAAAAVAVEVVFVVFAASLILRPCYHSAGTHAKPGQDCAAGEDYGRRLGDHSEGAK
jgi:hypothetical protein